MKPLKVIFIEKDKELFQSAQSFYARVFETAGYEAVFTWAEGEGGAHAEILNTWPHVVICDLGYEEQYAGLVVLANLSRDFPDLFFIGTSRGDYSPRDVQTKSVRLDLFIDKQSLFTDAEAGSLRRLSYIDTIAIEFAKSFMVNTDIMIENLDQLKATYKSNSERRELHSLLSQVMFIGHSGDNLMEPNVIRLHPLQGGLSGSSVFRLESRNRSSGIQGVPAVLKVSERDAAIKELRNYQHFVKWGLPYTWRVDALGSGFTRRLGAVAYSFVLSDQGKFDSLTAYLRDGVDDVILNTLRRIFSPDMRRWYGDELIADEKHLSKRYAQRYFRGRENRNQSEVVFMDVVQKALGAIVAHNKIVIDRIKYPRPRERLFGVAGGSYLTCIAHGDLNSNNVLVAESGGTIFIDFQETGRAHVFEDFITMEASIRLYYGDDKAELSAAEYLEREIKIGTGEDIESLSRMQRLIAEVRVLAQKNFPKEPFANYLFGVAMFNFRLLRADQLSLGQRVRCVCAILAALRQI